MRLEMVVLVVLPCGLACSAVGPFTQEQAAVFAAAVREEATSAPSLSRELERLATTLERGSAQAIRTAMIRLRTRMAEAPPPRLAMLLAEIEAAMALAEQTTRTGPHGPVPQPGRQ